jgi:hypothetical protein
VIAVGIELVDVETSLVRRFQSFVELQVENLKSEPLSLLDLARRRGDFNFKVRHAARKLTYRPSIENRAGHYRGKAFIVVGADTALPSRVIAARLMDTCMMRIRVNGA